VYRGRVTENWAVRLVRRIELRVSVPTYLSISHAHAQAEPGSKSDANELLIAEVCQPV